VDAIETEMRVLPEAEASHVEVFGSDAERIALPVVLANRVPIVGRDVAATLRSRPISLEAYEAHVVTIRDILMAWVGYEIDAVGDGSTVTPGGPSIVVSMPRRTIVSGSPRGFLSHILTQCPQLFDRLEMRFGEGFTSSGLRRLEGERGLRKIVLEPPTDFMLSWEDRGRIGRAKVRASGDNNDIEVIEISCQSQEGDSLPLEHLMPSLSDILDYLTS
jgi:hypothetical protein